MLVRVYGNMLGIAMLHLHYSFFSFYDDTLYNNLEIINGFEVLYVLKIIIIRDIKILPKFCFFFQNDTTRFILLTLW